jgi:hypothetical protein
MSILAEDIEKLPHVLVSILRAAPFIEKLEIHVSTLLGSYVPIGIFLLWHRIRFAFSPSILVSVRDRCYNLLCAWIRNLCDRQLKWTLKFEGGPLRTYVFPYTVLIIYTTMFESCSLLPVATFVLRTMVLWTISIFSGVNILI